MLFKEKKLTKKEIKEYLQAVLNSCYEGYTGEWDSHTTEGREGFLCMAENLAKASKSLGITLTEKYDLEIK